MLKQIVEEIKHVYDIARFSNVIFKICFAFDGRFIDLHHNVYLFYFLFWCSNSLIFSILKDILLFGDIQLF